MDIKQLLDELSHKVKDPLFSEIAQKFRGAIRQAQGYTSEEKRGFYKQYKQLWDERKAWLENRKHEQEHKIIELDYLLDIIDRDLHSDDFTEQAKSFEREYKRLGSLVHDKKEKLWARFQDIWEKRRQFLAEKQTESGSVKVVFESEILGIDTSFEGAPELRENSRWDHIGVDIRNTREKLREIRKRIEDNNTLLRPEKKLLFELIESVREKIHIAEETTFETHGIRAQQLIDEVPESLKTNNLGDVAETLKNVQSQIRMLWLRKGEKERFLKMAEDFWGQLKSKRKERKQQFIDWLGKQKEGLDKLYEIKSKAEDALARVQANLAENRNRLAESRSEEFTEKVNNWIHESEEKEKDILKSIHDLTLKIDEIQQKLKKHGMMPTEKKSAETSKDTVEQAPVDIAEMSSAESEPAEPQKDETEVPDSPEIE